MATNDLADLRDAFAELTDMHGWGGMQTPRNMTLALCARVGAVAGHLQFTSDRIGGHAGAAEQSSVPVDELPDELRADLADCLVYLLALADALGIDVADEATRRIRDAISADRTKEQT